MNKEERQKELRQRLVPEIKFSHAIQLCFVSTYGRLGPIASTHCDRGQIGDVEMIKRGQRITVTESIMRLVFEREGCL